MRRLVWGFVGRTCHIVGYPMPWLIYEKFNRNCFGQFRGIRPRIYIGNYFDNMSLTSHNVTLASQKFVMVLDMTLDFGRWVDTFVPVYHTQLIGAHNLSHDMAFPTMWCVRSANFQINLRIHLVWSKHLLVTWMTVKLLTEWGCTSLSEFTLVKMPHIIVGNHMSQLICSLNEYQMTKTWGNFLAQIRRQCYFSGIEF